MAEKLSHLDGFLTAKGVREMLREKHLSAIDTMIHFIAASTGRLTAYNDNPVLTGIHRMYSVIVIQILHSKAMVVAGKCADSELNKTIRHLNPLSRDSFCDVKYLYFFYAQVLYARSHCGFRYYVSKS